MENGRRKQKKQNWKRKELKPSDVIIQHGEARESDIVIPVMGPTGVGKSTFINALLPVGSPRMRVGHDLKSCTSTLQHTYISDIPNRPSLKGRRIVVVDTPGFDNTYMEDREILRRIAVWLASSYDADMKLGGVVYLHDISQTRVTDTTRKNFDIFHKICGVEAATSVILGTTKWGRVQRGVGERRETQLIETYWKDMINQGSRVQQFGNTSDSAWEIVYGILDALEKSEALQIQNELVNLQHIIPETKAGRTLRYNLQQLLDMQKQMAEELAAQAAGGNDARVQAKLEEHQYKMRMTLKQISDLKISISRRVMRLFTRPVNRQCTPANDAGYTVGDTPQQRGCRITKDLGVMILILGQTGVGKSTFINNIAGKDVADVSDEMQRCTSNVKHFTIEHHKDPTRRVIFVDTPGFNADGVWLDDNKILQEILDWLQTSCDQDIRFGGILYLQDINMSREVTGAFDMTSTKLSLPEIARHVLFATVKWKEPESPEQQRREQLMVANWSNMIDRGAQVFQLKSTSSPWSIVDNLLESTVELGVIRQNLNTTMGELSKRPITGRVRDFFFSLFHNVDVP